MVRVAEGVNRLNRWSVVAKLAVIVVLDDDGARCFCPTQERKPGGSDITAPVGNWCEGVTYTRRARDSPGAAIPSLVTGSVSICADAAVKTCRAPR
jgi:hypothetical protein